ncbi:TM2 domain-containing protein [Acetanaerobacterium elongatum]|uniref:Double zinc ribbon n=1 Tax=Acetanaerobacterium elongatum TaxID=258515 RepID=A0A1H0BTC0_9FIRM|nr:TM2 domain-containing protein [Acetanaerobacterium elongatum]SDN48827.1 Double zinc ribbon [Acetanaerobacterium elongatum]
MFCRNCGNELFQGASVCTKCGAQVGAGGNYCPNCGQQSDPLAVVCVKCGYQLSGQPVAAAPGTEQKSKMVAGLLGILLGWTGAHNFYLGFTGKAVAQLLISVLSCFILSPVSAIWGIIEGIFILTGKTTADAKGVPLKDN